MNFKPVNIKSIKLLGGLGIILGFVGTVLEEIVSLHPLLGRLSATSSPDVSEAEFSQAMNLSNLYIFSGAIGLAGFILVLAALKKLADETKRDPIFKDFLIGIIFQFVGLVLFVVVALILNAILSPEEEFSRFTLVAIILVFLLDWLIFIIGASFIRMSYNSIAEVTGEKLFSLAGTLIFLGSILVAVFFLGGIVGNAGYIVAAVAFFSLPDTLEVQTIAYT